MNPLVFVLAASVPLFPPVAPEALRADVTFLASDLLEGRDTPSRGLDIAANYIAAQFQKAGLKSAGDDGYFQTATDVCCRNTVSRPDAIPDSRTHRPIDAVVS